MVHLCTTFVVDPICRDLRALGGTSLDHKFLVGGPKSIYRPNPELVKLQPQLNDRVIPFLLIYLKKGRSQA